jgi:hypothetical protein
VPRAQQQGMAMQARAAWGAAKAAPTTTTIGRRTDPAPPAFPAAFPVVHPILTSCTFNRSISTSPSSSSALLAARQQTSLGDLSKKRGGACHTNSRAHAHANTPYVRRAMGALRQTPF